MHLNIINYLNVCCMSINFKMKSITFSLIVMFISSYQSVIGQNSINFNSLQKIEDTLELNDVLSDYEIYKINTKSFFLNNKALRNNTLFLNITYENNHFEFILEEVDRAHNTKYYTLDNSGKTPYVIPSNIKTYKGHFKDGRLGYIRLTIDDNNFIYGTIKDENEDYFIEPLHYFETNNTIKDKFILYNAKSISNHHAHYHCHRQEEEYSRLNALSSASRNSGQCYKVQYSVLADYSMFLDPAHPGTHNVISHITAVMNNVQGLYEYTENNNFTNGILFELNEIVVSTCSECDPVSDTKIASVCLNQFSEWVFSGGFTQEVHAAQFWTDRTFNNSIIGLAFQSTNLFCDNKAHSIIRDFTSTAALLRTLVAHEIGHNFNGSHDNVSGQILSPTVTATSTWSTPSKQIISNEILSQTACLNPCDDNTCQNISNLNLYDIEQHSFKISWNSISLSHSYHITLTNMRTNELIFETTSTHNIHTLSPSGYNICEKYLLTVQSICPNNETGLINKLIFSAPFDQGCADFISDCKVNWPNGKVKFTDKSINASSWFWNFGNGTTSNLQNPEINFIQPGTYDISLTVNNGNHTCTKNELIHILPIISPEPSSSTHNNDFTNQFKPDILEGSVNVWEYGSSNYNLKTDGLAWKTILNSNIPRRTYKSALYSPQFDFTDYQQYFLSFDLSMHVVFCNAPVAAQLQYSTDKGVTWIRMGDAPQFYNASPTQNCSINSRLFSDRTGWAFNDHYQHKNLDISFLMGEPNVVFRFVFAVSEIFNSGYDVDGLLIDNFKIEPENLAPLSIDVNSLAVKQLTTDANRLDWTASSTTEIERFDIFKSSNGLNYIHLHSEFVSDEKKSEYTYTDYNKENRFSQFTYYQVASIHHDGKTTYSNIVKVINTDLAIKIYPNPIQEREVLKIDIPFEVKSLNYKIINSNAQIVLEAQNSYKIKEIDISRLTLGHYHLIINTDNIQHAPLPFIVVN